MRLGPSCNAVLIRALERWTALWKNATGGRNKSGRRGVGNVGHVPELAWLTTKILQVSGTKEAQTSSYFQGIARDDTRDLHEFIRSHVSARSNAGFAEEL